METQSADREKIILERILTVKQIVQDGRGGPMELHELGICYFHLDNFKQAADYLDELLQTYPDYVEVGAVHALRAFALIQLRDFDPARETLFERLRLYPHDTRLLSMLAFIQEKTRQLGEAIETHRRILDLDSGNLNSLNSLGYLLALQGENLGEAFQCLKQVLQLKPGHPAYLDSFGVLLSKSGRNEEAQRALLQALARLPEPWLRKSTATTNRLSDRRLAITPQVRADP